MPKERRRRLGAHLPSIKLAKRQFALPETSERVEIGESIAASGSDILRDLSHKPARSESSTKKDKQQFKRETFQRRLELLHPPYSKSHGRRLKRKAKDHIGGGLGDMQAVLSAIEKDSIPTNDSFEHVSVINQKCNAQVGPGPFVESKAKNAPLTLSQRKRLLQMEKKRQPVILSNPAFISNPFHAIRTHVQNTEVAVLKQ